ncbi:MAG: hypothetical protein M1839_006774 [Geoglossum umbratile]|nr:MAG: hypothetical protein M1839_006774 [Geoglossum umbratile]
MCFPADTPRPGNVKAVISVTHNCSEVEPMADIGMGRTLLPDLGFGPAGARFLLVVIKVTFPQERKALSKLASGYIASSSGNVQLVVASIFNACYQEWKYYRFGALMKGLE